MKTTLREIPTIIKYEFKVTYIELISLLETRELEKIDGIGNIGYCGDEIAISFTVEPKTTSIEMLRIQEEINMVRQNIAKKE